MNARGFQALVPQLGKFSAVSTGQLAEIPVDSLRAHLVVGLRRIVY